MENFSVLPISDRKRLYIKKEGKVTFGI